MPTQGLLLKADNIYKYCHLRVNIDSYCYSFSPCTIHDWETLPSDTVDCQIVNSFKECMSVIEYCVLQKNALPSGLSVSFQPAIYLVLPYVGLRVFLLSMILLYCFPCMQTTSWFHVTIVIVPHCVFCLLR